VSENLTNYSFSATQSVVQHFKLHKVLSSAWLCALSFAKIGIRNT